MENIDSGRNDWLDLVSSRFLTYVGSFFELQKYSSMLTSSVHSKRSTFFCRE